MLVNMMHVTYRIYSIDNIQLILSIDYSLLNSRIVFMYQLSVFLKNNFYRLHYVVMLN